jgi:outer membrane protein OmpA-like peptidoglycan-associated protein
MLMPKTRRSLTIGIPVLLVSAFIGCAYPKEVKTANELIEAARAAGKDKQCPNEFMAAENLKNQAYALCKQCDMDKAIALANEAIARANALCPSKPMAEMKAAPAPVVPAPTVSLSANPGSVKEGQCATLTWSAANSSSISIDPGVGKVDSSGSRQVCPDRTTSYRIAATGEGGSRDASTTVTVIPKVIDRLTLHVNFDFNKATVRKPDDADLQKAKDFVKKYPDSKISLVGYTDSIGSDAYNQGLSERRAEAVKAHLVADGVDAARIQTSGRGKADPVGDNATDQGRFENRRVEILILSE